MSEEVPLPNPPLSEAQRRGEVRRLTDGWEAEAYLARSSEVTPSEEELVDWLTSRGDWLPLLGWNRHLVRSVAQLDPAERQRYLAQLVGDILEPEEQGEWQVLRQRQRDAVTQLVRFWRRRRALDSSRG